MKYANNSILLNNISEITKQYKKNGEENNENNNYYFYRRPMMVYEFSYKIGNQEMPLKIIGNIAYRTLFICTNNPYYDANSCNFGVYNKYNYFCKEAMVLGIIKNVQFTHDFMLNKEFYRQITKGNLFNARIMKFLYEMFLHDVYKIEGL